MHKSWFNNRNSWRHYSSIIFHAMTDTGLHGIYCCKHTITTATGTWHIAEGSAYLAIGISEASSIYGSCNVIQEDLIIPDEVQIIYPLMKRLHYIMGIIAGRLCMIDLTPSLLSHYLTMSKHTPCHVQCCTQHLTTVGSTCTAAAAKAFGC